MKSLLFTFNYSSAMNRYYIRDDAEADTAYAAFKKAMGEFKEYGNDKDRTVSFTHGSGEATLRVSAIISISIDSLDAESEATVRAIRAWDDRFKDLDEKRSGDLNINKGGRP